MGKAGLVGLYAGVDAPLRCSSPQAPLVSVHLLFFSQFSVFSEFSKSVVN